MFPGFGTLLNVTTVVAGAAVGVALGHRFPARTRDTVIDALGLLTLLIGLLGAFAVRDQAFVDAVGSDAPVLLVLGALVLGGIAGSLARIESRLEALGHALQARTARRAGAADRQRFVEGYVTSSLVFCVGPLTVLGSLSDGLGLGSQQLVLKSALDGFAAIAFAASFGWGVAATGLTVLLVQGTLTGIGALLGEFLDAAQISALTATGGLLLVGVALRLLQVKRVPVADLLPALAVAPFLTWLVSQI